jgi:hypothetical protein
MALGRIAGVSGTTPMETNASLLGFARDVMATLAYPGRRRKCRSQPFRQ